MSVQLPTLGRNPFNSIRIVSGCERQAFDYVDPNAEFVRGMIGKQSVDSDGQIQWSVYDGSSGKPAGILNSHKTSSLYRSISKKPVTIDSSTGKLVPYLLNDSVRIEKSDGTDITSDFTIDYTSGIIKDTTGSHEDETVYASFRYLLASEGGIDETKGSGKVSIIRGVGEIATLVYDTKAPINAGDNLKSYNGVPSTRSGLSGDVIGVVVKPPTYTDPELRFRINL